MCADECEEGGGHGDKKAEAGEKFPLEVPKTPLTLKAPLLFVLSGCLSFQMYVFWSFWAT